MSKLLRFMAVLLILSAVIYGLAADDVKELIGGNSNTPQYNPPEQAENLAPVVEGVEQAPNPVETVDPVVSEPIDSGAAILAEHYPADKFTHEVIENSAFEDLNGGDVSGYRTVSDGVNKHTEGSIALYSDNPDHASVLHYLRTDVSNQLGPGATMEFYTPVDDKVVMGAYAEALDKSRIPHVFASVTDSNGKIVYRGPWFSNNAADYSDAAQNGGLNSEIYTLKKGFMLSKGVPESYFDVVESV